MKIRLILVMSSLLLIGSACSIDDSKSKEDKRQLQKADENAFSDSELEFFESNGFILDEESEVSDQFNLGHKRQWRKTKKSKRSSKERVCKSVIKLASVIWSKRAVCNHFESKREKYESGSCWVQIASHCGIVDPPSDGGSVDGGSVDGGGGIDG